MVYVDDDDNVVGFIGLTNVNISYQDKIYSASIGGALMVEDHEQHPLRGARLVRQVVRGPQQILITETANNISVGMWESLKGVQLTEYSIDWLRIIRPLGFVQSTLAERFGFLRFLSPLTRVTDNWRRKKMPPQALRWSGVPENWQAAQATTVVPIGKEEFSILFASFADNFAARPSWQDGQFAACLDDAMIKPVFGDVHMGKVQGKTGKTIGIFIYHLKPGGTARVLQLMAAPKAHGLVIDAVINDAAVAGAVAIRGRVQPALLQAMLGKRIAFTHLASTMILSREPDILQAAQAGEMLLNGFVGEHWSRLSGNDF